MAIALKPLTPGKYIVAVSGGVDSMALLNLLCKQPALELVVAHVNHGMRPDSDVDEKLVVSFCKSHNIAYKIKKLHLAAKTSEAVARDERYDFLRQCRTVHNALAIITAHHEDDLIETALINLLRGTGWRGIAPFTNSPDIKRPLVDATKKQLRNYAAEHHVPWHEDTTNTDERYFRNYIRTTLVPFLTRRNSEWREDFLRIIRNQQVQRRTIEDELASLLRLFVKMEEGPATLKRYDWTMLPQPEAYELFQALCRAHVGNSLVRELANQSLIFIKTARPGKVMPLNNSWRLHATPSQIIVEPTSAVVS